MTLLPSTLVIAAGCSLNLPRGAPDLKIVQANINFTICAAGYTKRVRPSVTFSSRLKRQMLRGRPARSYELDHIIPLEVGGAPMDQKNFQLQLWPAARAKDHLENRVHKAVCAGTMTLTQGQAVFRLRQKDSSSD